MPGYTCATCGKYHDELPLHYGVALPDHVFSIPEQERSQRCQISDDLCVVDDEFFFILGNIEIQIIGSHEPFSWDAWASLSRQSFERTTEIWQKKGREKEPPFFGWLNTSISIYPETMNLKTMVHTRPMGIRPFIELEPTDHPLAVEQQTGITMARVEEIAALVLHGNP